MKKVLSVLAIFFITMTTTFWYTPTSKDELLLGAVNKKLDSILQKSPTKIENLYKQISLIKERVRSKERIYYILTELENYSYKILTNRDNIEYLVNNVVDWDTASISYLWKESKVRFIWIDTPESNETRFWYKECYWEVAKTYLKNLIEWKKIKLELDTSQWKTDKYDRLLWYIVYEWENINNKLIQEWYAWEYTYDKVYKYQDLFKFSQTSASESKKWLWAENTCNWERVKIWEIIETETNTQENNYVCWEKLYCTQMTSCEEAKFYLNSCLLKRLDSDWDWVPCESLCQ